MQTDTTVLPPLQDQLIPQVVKRPRGRPRRYPATEVIMIDQLEFHFDCKKFPNPVANVYLSNKEILDLRLSQKLRKDGIIDATGQPFELSIKKEIEGLIAQGVFEFIPYDHNSMAKHRLFKSRLVNEIKEKGTPMPYEISRLVIQAYNDEDKANILT